MDFRVDKHYIGVYFTHTKHIKHVYIHNVKTNKYEKKFRK